MVGYLYLAFVGVSIVASMLLYIHLRCLSPYKARPATHTTAREAGPALLKQTNPLQHAHTTASEPPCCSTHDSARQRRCDPIGPARAGGGAQPLASRTLTLTPTSQLMLIGFLVRGLSGTIHALGCALQPTPLHTWYVNMVFTLGCALQPTPLYAWY